MAAQPGGLTVRDEFLSANNAAFLFGLFMDDKTLSERQDHEVIVLSDSPSN